MSKLAATGKDIGHDSNNRGRFMIIEYYFDASELIFGSLISFLLFGL